MTLGGAASANALSDLKAGETKTIPTKDVIEALGDFGYKGGNSVKEVNAALGELGFKSSGNSGKMVIKGTKQSVATMDYIYSGDDPGEDKKGGSGTSKSTSTKRTYEDGGHRYDPKTGGFVKSK